MLENVKKLRKRDRVSQQALANVLGVSQQSVNKYENHNVEPSIDTLKKMARYFNVSIDFIVGKTDEENSGENDYSMLNSEEFAVVENYRKLSKQEKQSLVMVMENYLKNNH